MAMIELDLNGLAVVHGGRVNLMFIKAMARIAADLAAAPDHDGARVLTVKVKAKPRTDAHNGRLQLTGVDLEFEVDGRTPSRVTSYTGDVRCDRQHQHRLCFNLDSPDNPDQLTFFDREGNPQSQITEVDEPDAE